MGRGGGEVTHCLGCWRWLEWTFWRLGGRSGGVVMEWMVREAYRADGYCVAAAWGVPVGLRV